MISIVLNVFVLSCLGVTGIPLVGQFACSSNATEVEFTVWVNVTAPVLVLDINVTFGISLHDISVVSGELVRDAKTPPESVITDQIETHDPHQSLAELLIAAEIFKIIILRFATAEEATTVASTAHTAIRGVVSAALCGSTSSNGVLSEVYIASAAGGALMLCIIAAVWYVKRRARRLRLEGSYVAMDDVGGNHVRYLDL
jgi:hypothetical protein